MLVNFSTIGEVFMFSPRCSQQQIYEKKPFLSRLRISIECRQGTSCRRFIFDENCRVYRGKPLAAQKRYDRRSGADVSFRFAQRVNDRRFTARTQMYQLDSQMPDSVHADQSSAGCPRFFLRRRGAKRRFVVQNTLRSPCEI